MREFTRAVAEAIETLAPALVALSHEIHTLAEVKFEEHRSAAALIDFLREQGFQTEIGVTGLSTAFVSRAGEGGPRLCLVAEYDALPGLGHGCGHNLIGPVSVGAAAAAVQTLTKANIPARIEVVGAPAEEGGGGKVRLVEAGIFDGYDAVMMLHPYHTSMRDHGTLAMASLTAIYRGRAAHASAQPQEGINALEAAIQAYVAINGLRQHLPPDTRVHGIIREGGQAPNVVPDRSVLEFLVRAPDSTTLALLKKRVIACFEAAGLATGCQCEVNVELEYQARVPNEHLQDLLAAHLATFGFDLGPLAPGDGRGSSDMGDVSQVVPTVQPYFAICKSPTTWHSTDVVRAAVSERADVALVQVSKALAATCVELASSPQLLEEIKAEFESTRRSQIGDEV